MSWPPNCRASSARPLKIGYFSTVHEGGYIRPGEVIHDVDYWKKGLRHSVYFTHGHPQRRRQRPHHVPGAGTEPGGAHAGWPDHRVGGTARRAADRDPGPQAGRGRLHGRRDGAAVRLRPRPGFPDAVLPGVEPDDYADIPPTRFKRKEHWLNAQFSADGSSLIPGTHVAMPDGRHVWEYAAQGPTDLAALVKAAAVQVLPDATLTASEQRAVPGDGARLVTTLTRHPGGRVGAGACPHRGVVHAGLRRHRHPLGCRRPALPAAVATGVAVVANGAAAATTRSRCAAEDDCRHPARQPRRRRRCGRASWASGPRTPARPCTTGWALIVGSAMGYEPEDLPWEVPLIELGLDSLMAVRIKNRVEYDFDLPPIQLTAVRDANLYAVEQFIVYAIENREQVAELAEHQKAHDARGDRRRAGRAGGRRDPGGVGGETRRQAPGGPRTGPRTAAAPTNPAAHPAAAHRSVRTRHPAPARPTRGRRAPPSNLPLPQPPRKSSPSRPSSTRSAPTSHRGRPPNASPSPPGRSSPASRRAASSTNCPNVDDDTAAKIAAAAHRTLRGHHHRRGSQGGQDHRGAGHHGARVPRSRRTRRLRPDPARAERRVRPSPGVRLPPGRRIDGGLRAAAQAAARRHPDVWPGAGRGLHRGARRRVRAQADGDGRQGPVHPGRLVTGRGAGLRLRRSA